MGYDGFSYVPGKNSQAIPWQTQYNRLFQMESNVERQRAFRLLNKRVDWHRDDDYCFLNKHRCVAGAARKFSGNECRVVCEHMFYRATSNRTLNVAWEDVRPSNSSWLEVEDFARTRYLSDLLRERDYEPDEFRRHEIPKPSGGKRVLHIPSETDRIVQRAIYLIVEPYLDSFFQDFTFGWRRRVNRIHALAAAGWLAKRQDRYWVVIADIKDAFPSTPTSRVYQLLRKYLYKKTDICDLIELTLSKHKTGLPQGSPLSPMLLNLYLHHNLDKKWCRLQTNKPLLRYCDDIMLLCKSESEARQGYSELSRLLTTAGFRLKNDVDSSVHNSSGRRPVDWLGFNVSYDPFCVRISEKSWNRLDCKLGSKAPFHESSSDNDCWLILGSWLGEHVPALKWEKPSEVAKRANQIFSRHGIPESIDVGQILDIRDRRMRHWSVAKNWARERLKNNFLR